MPRMTEETKRLHEEQKGRSAKRVNWILDKYFCGDKGLMAFVCDTNMVTLNRWLDGKTLINSAAAFSLSNAIPNVSRQFVMGDVCDERDEHEPEMWEVVEMDHIRDVFDYRRRLVRELVGIQGNIKRYRDGDLRARYR